jgi:SAM-dependent methyltransferase
MDTKTQEIELSQIEEARKYTKAHKKWAKFMYLGILKDIKKFNISGRYLEAGAGPGFLATIIARQNPEVTITAVDISPGMSVVANEYITEKGLGDRIKYLIGDSTDEKLMKELGKFDFVYSTYSVHHFEDPEKAISNLWDGVANNGILYIYDFKKIGWLCSLPFKDQEIISMNKAFTPGEARTVLQKTGIKKYKVKTVFPYMFQSIIAWK